MHGSYTHTHLAINVFPVPGGPKRRIPRGGYHNTESMPQKNYCSLCGNYRVCKTTVRLIHELVLSKHKSYAHNIIQSRLTSSTLTPMVLKRAGCLRGSSTIYRGKDRSKQQPHSRAIQREGVCNNGHNELKKHHNLLL